MDLNTATAPVTASLKAGHNVMLWGAPGIGKSDFWKQIAANMGNIPINDRLRASTLQPVDLMGMPVPDHESQVMIWYQMGLLPDADRDGPVGILHLDEINTGSQMVQGGLMQLTLDKQIGDYRLPEGWMIAASGNRVSDRASANRMSSALSNRFAHYEIAVSVDAWCKWALANGVPAAYVAFIRFRPELLHSFEPDRVINATPRTHAMAADMIEAGLDPQTELQAIAACIGDGPASEVTGFLRVWRSLPSPDAVLMNPDSQPVPDKADVMFALCGALARKVTEQSMGNFIRYISKLPTEFGIKALDDAIARDPSLASTEGAIAFYSANGDVYT